ncbi:MAG: nickel-dependent hydrogenase large subunit [Candidatus Heimdallarchaeaceae archaeon]
MTVIKFNKPIVVDHIARIEGKAGIEVSIGENKEVEVKVNVFEGPRFFESITVGKPLEEATAIFPRICSFCAAAHKITALQAAENAIGLEPSEQTKKLRELLYLGDQIESHALHLFLLALPDFLGYPDSLTMAKNHPNVVKTALKLKDIGAIIQTVIGSRYIHQENALIGGFGKLPTKTELEKISSSLEELKSASQLALKQFSNYELWPEVTSERTHLALEPYGNTYGVLGDTIKASDKTQFKATEYPEFIKEIVVPHSFAKHAIYNGKPFVTGALSRMTLFRDLLSDSVKEFIAPYEQYLNPANPLANNIAQSIEMIYFVEKAKELALEIAENLKQEKRVKPLIKEGVGFSVTEAPRGLLTYKLEVDEKGLVKNADVITPTVMFLAQKEIDLRNMTEAMLEQGIDDPQKISHKLETIVRSYDPCISCSVHVAKIKRK